MAEIIVSNLYKEYKLGLIGSSLLRDDFENWWIKKIRKGYTSIKNQPRIPIEYSKTFWALHNVSFEVQKGEVFGIIGKNGAGKSTLLKILSKITNPTKGQVAIKGRIASLLEVGTGFHPELTGRENIFLNGAILGMKKPEINSKLEEIIDFSGIAKFIDTPVKRYSSGMYVRLAFAVAAHLEPEILIIDEVLAVGDAEFQKKCISKMDDVSSKNGRTIIFVSHNLTAVAGLCDTVALLNKGIIEKIGLPSEIINDYLYQSRLNIQNLDLSSRHDFLGDGRIRIGHVLINGENDCRVYNNQEVQIEFEINNLNNQSGYLELAGGILSYDSTYLCYFSSKLKNKQYYITKDNERICVQFPQLPFAKGNYYFSLEIKLNNEIVYVLNDAFKIEILDGNFYRSGIYWDGGGKFLIAQNWF